MKHICSMLSVTFLLLFSFCAFAQTSSELKPLNNSDKLSLVINGLSSNDDVRVKFRVGLCVSRTECKELFTTDDVRNRAGQNSDYSKRPLNDHRSKVYTGSDLNQKFNFLAKDRAGKVSNPVPMIAVQMLVDTGGDKGKSQTEFIEFPRRNFPPNKYGQINRMFNLSYNGPVQSKLSLLIERQN